MRMKQRFLRILDSWITDDIKQFEQQEELVRARTLVFIFLANSAVSALGLLSLPFESAHVFINFDGITTIFSASIVGFFIGLWIFKRVGLFVLSGNIYALVSYFSIIASVLWQPRQEMFLLLLLLLVVPIIVSLVANLKSAIFWLLLITVTPFIVVRMGNQHIDSFFIGSWLGCCSALFFVLQMEHYYRETLRRRLNSERTHFEFAAAHDALTGLVNRATFDRRLQEGIDYCVSHNTKTILLYIDLDKFKPINDSYGHQAGDIVLTIIAKRLKQLVRRNDTVARMGGDEFAILFSDCDPEQVEPIIDRLDQTVREPIEVQGGMLEVACSVGKVICPDDGVAPDQLARKADERMYQAKRARDLAQVGQA